MNSKRSLTTLRKKKLLSWKDCKVLLEMYCISIFFVRIFFDNRYLSLERLPQNVIFIFLFLWGINSLTTRKKGRKKWVFTWNQVWKHYLRMLYIFLFFLIINSLMTSKIMNWVSRELRFEKMSSQCHITLLLSFFHQAWFGGLSLKGAI